MWVTWRDGVNGVTPNASLHDVQLRHLLESYLQICSARTMRCRPTVHDDIHGGGLKSSQHRHGPSSILARSQKQLQLGFSDSLLINYGTVFRLGLNIIKVDLHPGLSSRTHSSALTFSPYNYKISNSLLCLTLPITLQKKMSMRTARAIALPSLSKATMLPWRKQPHRGSRFRQTIRHMQAFSKNLQTLIRSRER